MKLNLSGKKLSLSMIIIVILCLIVTGIILVKIVTPAEAKPKRLWFIQESLDTKQPIRLENAYIVSDKDGMIQFVYDHVQYEVEGNLGGKFQGVADIIVEAGSVSKIYGKPDMAEGILMRYTKENLVVEPMNDPDVMEASVPMVKNIIYSKMNDRVPVYLTKNDKVEEITWNRLVVGNSVIKAVMEQGKVAALVVEQETVPKVMNVLLRNGPSIFYKEIFIRKVYENTLVNVKEVLTNNLESEMLLYDKKGLILCDANNQPMGKTYEGELMVFQTSEGLVIVNKLDLETYLKYVIPSEMPKTFSKEALKAQAVCARTFAYMQTKNGAYAAYGANLDNTTDYQVYNLSGRQEETDVAVEETKGEVILYKDEPINCYYYSANAGVSNDLSVWAGENPEYIGMRGMEYANELDLTKEEDFTAFIQKVPDSKDKDAPFYRWTVTLDTSKIKEKTYGKLQSIEIKKRNQAGYITELILRYEKEEIMLHKENDIRKTIGQYMSELKLSTGEIRTNMTMIPSACFKVTQNTEGNFILQGGGYGHAIGLSQYGANHLALEGMNYKEILQYYFSNIMVKEL